ncbi:MULTISPECIES: type II secretion system minor pseudopilin GspJ [unclassified Marinimicrobium]|uniref:type II secretion system minor pseudopilin GspJ n=1 Tax=unclassified Marinimicrobium TaxID=2632100 RepID=UPI000C45A841|nr:MULTISPECIES: type II secretion system minor pseudopilin GspJ [unclassified Marinimicrobium]MAN51268.1 type II secretion system protein GspJ [Marinimicrobium sp.]
MRSPRLHLAPQRGFTLLEMMVALAIAAAIATMAYQALDSASRGAERSREVMEGINRLDRAWQIISADLRHILAPEPGGPTGLRNPFAADPFGGIGQEERLMLFTRHSWLNPMERLRSDLQEVSYRLEEGTLWRDYRPVRNRPFDEYDFEEQALRQRLLDGVTSVELRFLSQALLSRSGRSALDGDDYLRDWAEAWPDPDQVGGNPAELPLAVLVRIEMEGVGVSERLFEITQFHAD